MGIKKIVHTYFYLIFSQLITLVLNIMMSTVFPKIMNLRDFGYWQLFLFYSSFVGFFHFGLNDGVYLRYGGKSVDKTNKELLKGQFLLLFFLQLFLALIISCYQLFFGRVEVREIVYYTLAFMVFSNLSSFITIYFQASNRLRYFSNASVITSALFLLSVGSLFLLKKFTIHYLIIFYLISYLIGFIYVSYIFQDFLKERLQRYNFRYYVKNFATNTYVGFFLMISTVSSMLILGIGRYLIERKWGISVFGKVSLSFTLITFMLFFIRQISLVIFPLLKKTNSEQQKKVLGISIDFLNVLLLGMLLIMPAVDFFIRHWLPNYSESLKYFVYIVPIALYEGKMQVILNTYMKVLRKEKQLMQVNIISMGISAILCLIGYYLGSIDFIIISMTIATLFRGTILEQNLRSHFGVQTFERIFVPLIMVVLFVITFHYFKMAIATALYASAYILYIYLNFAGLKKLAVMLKNSRI